MTSTKNDAWLQTLVAECDGLGSDPTIRFASVASAVHRSAAASNDGERARGLAEAALRVSHPDALEVGEAIAEGGMGLIRLARQVVFGRDVAVKSVRPEVADDLTSVELLREAWLTGALEHPNVVPVHDIVFDKQRDPMIVLKRIVGKSWAELIHDPEVVAETFEANDLLVWNLDVLLHIVNAVRFAHSRGIVHRDIKPANVMIGEYGEVYLVDWGLAVSLEDDADGRYPTVSKTAVPTLTGTPLYMAPEMLGRPGSSVTRQTDIYLLGAVLFEIVSGRPPHKGATLAEVVTDVATGEPDWPETPPALVSICKRALAKDPSERYASADELRTELKAYLVHRGSTELAERAQASAEKLKALIALDQLETVDALFAECRFGFRAALATWQQNALAATGLRDMVIKMAELEVSRGQWGAARAHLVELTDPPEKLLALISEKQSADNARAQRLDALEADHDRRAWSQTRLVMTVVLGLVWTALPIIHHFSIDDQASQEQLFLISTSAAVVFLVMIGAIGFFARKSIRRTFLNRKLYLTFFAMAVSGLLLLIGGNHLEVPLATIHVIFLLVFAIIIGMFTLMADGRTFPIPLVYIIGFVVAIFDPGLRFFMMSMGHLVAVITALVIWSPRSGRLFCEPTA